MFRLVFVLAIGFLSASVEAVLPRYDQNLNGGCVDCFNFVAPSVMGAESIVSPEIGLMVYDASYGIFRGYNSGGKWIKISDDNVVRTITSSATAAVTDDEILSNATSGAITVTLPAAANVSGKEFVIKKIDSSANAVSIDGNSSETIDGLLTQSMVSQYDSIKIVSDGTGWNIVSRYKTSVSAPTIQKFTSSTGTYTTPAGVRSIRVRMVGGGGGGSGSGSSGGGNGGTGGNTTFGSSLLVANGGTAGLYASTGGTGGSASLGTGPIGLALSGGSGTGGAYAQVAGGEGAASAFGGGGGGGKQGGSAGYAGATNTGGGGGGGGSNGGGNVWAGCGGGSGGFLDAIISAPSSSYSYAVGAGGSAGSAGTSGYAGGAGGSGIIIVEEYYQ